MKICEELIKTDRWGCNKQPTLKHMIILLIDLPIKNICVGTGGDKLILEISEHPSVTKLAKFILNSSPDEIHTNENDLSLTLWWD